ncbi:hypothetical protein CERZMDRAFT_101547 [Cercospora zeae-maydis SCOH1-5]|uniref:Uncharacterized protein n=1 Tax=Cercospora zeae-maydis SCOH1-5 TaxID=717836 RepID=A0A6A6F3A9_9PEZI|nr:hypothetical protein CERZMDRAFT_101547 [Cercospora zeae-maydis SCOH1-5]
MPSKGFQTSVRRAVISSTRYMAAYWRSWAGLGQVESACHLYQAMLQNSRVWNNFFLDPMLTAPATTDLTSGHQDYRSSVVAAHSPVEGLHPDANMLPDVACIALLSKAGSCPYSVEMVSTKHRLVLK